MTKSATVFQSIVSEDLHKLIATKLQEGVNDAKANVEQAGEAVDPYQLAAFTRAVDALLAWETAVERITDGDTDVELRQTWHRAAIEHMGALRKLITPSAVDRDHYAHYAGHALRAGLSPADADGIAAEMLRLETVRFGERA